jgi:hypothetical protein
MQSLVADWYLEVRADREHEHGHAARVEAIRAEALVSQIWQLQQDTLDTLESAREAGDFRLFFIGVREARGNAELLGRLGGFMQAQDAATPSRIEVVFDSPPLPPRAIEGQVLAREDFLIPESV